jgi:hypothetical protein
MTYALRRSKELLKEHVAQIEGAIKTGAHFTTEDLTDLLYDILDVIDTLDEAGA